VRIPAAIILSVFTVVAQQALPLPPPPPQLPRDVVRRPEPTGTAVIRGRVVAADSGNPIRRATVNLSAMSPAQQAGAPPGRGGTTMVNVARGSMAGPRRATTDAQGAFEFTGLPAGSYGITAFAGQYSGQYLAIAYGAKRPNAPFSVDPGEPIKLTDGQTFDKAVIALPRGGVITGRVTDENADPLARVQVYTLLFPPGSTRGQRTNAGGQSDDLGQFRLYGLQPGEYAVVAEARGNTFVQPNAPPETEEEKIGFMTTYYPGTTDESAAQRVRVRAASETPGIEIRLGVGRLFRISGTVMDSQGSFVVRGNIQLTRRGGGSGSSSFGSSTDPQGQFQMRNIPPGTYRLIVRPNFNPGGPGAQAEPGEMANLPLTIAGADLDNVVVTTTPGVTITGQVDFEQGPPSPMPTPMRIMASIGNPDDMMGMPGPQPGLVTPELTFTIKGMMGEYLLRAMAPGQYVKSITVNGEDVTDTPREFKTNERVTVTLTSRVSMLEGNVTDAKGAVSTDVGVILFSEEKALWRFNSTRTKRAMVDPTGHFRIAGLMAGRYLIAALPRERLNVPPSLADAALFEQLAKEATPLVVGEDEQRRVDLKVVVLER
jgi:carboxypeptidase family protein